MLATACGPARSGANAADSAATTASAGSSAAATNAGSSTVDSAGVDHSQMAAMTGNPDQDFLRMMSDHHKGLIALVHLTNDSKDASAAVRADARKLDTTQDAELDTMTTMLESTFKDSYQPKIMPKHQAMADSLATLHGAAFHRTFYQDVITHHQEGLKMMSEYLPKLKSPDLTRMLQRMREAQAREITEFEGKRDAIK